MTAHRLAGRLRFLRPALIAVLVLDVIALGAFAIRVEQVTRTISIPAATVQPAAPLAPAPTSIAPVPLPPAVPISATLPEDDAGTSPVPVAPRPSPSPSAPKPTPTSPGTEEPGTTVARCPVPLKEPTTSGGLQTLISYAPAFGPFRDEAFAAAAAYQPVLQLLGPILARYPQIAPTIEPAMAPFLTAFAGLLDQGYAVLGPLYAPHRSDVLAAEAKLAAALAPYSQKLATSPLGGCVIELQAALLEDSATQGTKAAG